MARITQVQKIEQDNESQALAFFRATLAALPDPRRPQGTRYPLEGVVVIALMGMVCGCDDAEGMELWAEANGEWLKSFLDLPHGTPTQDVFLSVFGALNPEAFSAVFRTWAELLALRLKSVDRHIAVDGKTSRRSFDTARGQTALHTVSAWLTEAGLVLAQQKTADKSNEITAIPELLRVLDLKGATITIDAMGCQTEIAKTIIEGGGNYLIAVKTFAEASNDRKRSCDELVRPEVEIFEDHDKGHGRMEKRSVSITRNLDWLTDGERWPGLKVLVQVRRERTLLATQKTSSETAYYIGSDGPVGAERAGQTIRRHWGVESELHWVLDMAFREDEARHRSHNTAQNMTTLRHFAINIIKGDNSRKVGVANSRKRAGFDRRYLLQLLLGANGSESAVAHERALLVKSNG